MFDHTCRLFFGLVLCAGTLWAAETGAQRPYRIDDASTLEEVEIRSLTSSPDGQALAFTRRRSALSQLTNGLLIPETRDDVWLHEAPGQPARNLTNGAADSSGWWNPQWSPDSKRLAFLSSRGGHVTLWVWERATDEIRQLSTQGIDFFRATSDRAGFDGAGYREAFRWVDANHLICLALVDGERSTPMEEGKHVEWATAAWEKAARGEMTASVVDSLEFRYPERRLLMIEVATGKDHVIATTQAGGMWGIQPSLWWLSPDAKAVAFVPHVSARYQTFERTRLGFPWPIELRYLDGRSLHLDKALPGNIVTETLQWSPDGRSLAFFAYGDAPINPELLYGEEGAKAVVHERTQSRESPARLWRVSLDRGRVEEVDTRDLDLSGQLKPPAFLWAASGELLLHASRRSVRGAAKSEPEWLVLVRDARARALLRRAKAAAAKVLPVSIHAIDGGAAFIGVLEADVWRIDPVKGTMRNLTARLAPRVAHIHMPRDAQRPTHVAISVGEPRNVAERDSLRLGFPVAMQADYVLDLRTDEITPLRMPAKNTAIVAFDSTSRSAVYLAADYAGTFLWRAAAEAEPEPLMAANQFLATIVRPGRRLIEYTTLNGEKMKALLDLPHGYQPGRRYPLVVDFDIGYTPDNNFHFYTDLSHPPNLFEDGDAFTAAGYAYLFACWPSNSMDQAGRANLLLGTQGVLPAVDKVVELGIADPDRLFLYGISSAGYGTFALVTQTSRFKAAVAAVGWVDQVTHQLTASPNLRYTENPFDGGWRGPVYSSYQLLPFWLSADHLRRNSPLSYVDRVRTPLMIIHSDLDISDITQPEMFFRALIMQSKPARFVRYWGEGHGNRTPANVRDQFQRIFAWYDDYGDIARDAQGRMVFEGDRVKSRNGAAALRPEDFARFGPAAPALPPQAARSE